MKNRERRINIIIGQLEGVKKRLVSEDSDCLELINQLKAVRSGVGSLMEEMVSYELDDCLAKNKTERRTELRKFIKEIIKN